MPAFAETSDVLDVLSEFDGAKPQAFNDTFVEAAITGASGWFARATNGHWYDSGGTVQSDLIDTAARSATNNQLDVPSSPHQQPRYIISDKEDAKYPVTNAGPYAKIKLPHPYVTNLTTLNVRQIGGDFDDWTSDKTEGVGEDFYIRREGQDSYGRTHLYIDAREIGARYDFTNLLELDYDYGLDYDTEAWDDVLRGIASLAAIELMEEDNVVTQLPESGTLIGINTQYDNLLSRARTYLDPYLSAMG